MERIRNEIKIHTSLNHPNIIKFYGNFEDENYFYLVLEICAKGELYKYMKENNLSGNENVIRGFAWQIVDAIEYLHDRQIIHRDLKLSNILLTQDMQIVICYQTFSYFIQI